MSTEELDKIRGMQLSKLEEEFISVAELQRRILPAREHLTAFGEFDIVGKTIPTSVVGGDFHDFINLEAHGMKGKIGVVIADASGHGLPAAMLIRDFNTAVRTAISFQTHYAKDTTPMLFHKINRRMYRCSQPDQFISAFYGELRVGGTLHYINAGHFSPLLFKKKGIVELDVGCPVLGAFLDLPGECQVGKAKMDAKDILVCYTDGIVEAREAGGNEYGVARLKEVVQANRKLEAEKIFNLIIQDVESFSAEDGQNDDRTLIIIKKTH